MYFRKKELQKKRHIYFMGGQMSPYCAILQTNIASVEGGKTAASLCSLLGSPPMATTAHKNQWGNKKMVPSKGSKICI